MPKVSICIPAYNQVVHLKRTLDSILEQTYQDYEVIVTDDTPGLIVKELVEQYDFGGRLHYFKNETSLGTPENWNEAIRKASGEYIKILHHDDWFTYDYSLREYVQLLDNNPQISFAFSGSVVLFENLDSWIHSISDEQFAVIQNNPVSLFKENKIGAPSAVIFKKENGILFDENLKWLVDIKFYIQTLLAGNKVAYTPVALVTTFAAAGRVSDECSNDKKIEIYEHFYLLENIMAAASKTHLNIKECYRHIINVCAKYNVYGIAEIRSCGFNGAIPSLIKRQLFLKRQLFRLKRLAKQLLRR